MLADPPGSGLYNRIKYGVMFDLKEREGTRRRQQVDTIVEGIGINRVTANFEAGRQLIDDAVRVSDDQAKKMAQWLVEKDGIFVGSSSAVNCERRSRPPIPRVLLNQHRCCCSSNSPPTRSRAYNRDDSMRFRHAAFIQVLGCCR